MDMNVITSAASNALANIVLAVIALAGAYAVYYIRLAGAQVKAQTKQIEDKTARELLENALDDVVNLATVSVNAMEQTTAQAVRDKVKEGKGAFGYNARDAVTRICWPQVSSTPPRYRASRWRTPLRSPRCSSLRSAFWPRRRRRILRPQCPTLAWAA